MFFLLAGASPLQAGEATVLTRDGARLSGPARLEHDTVVVANLARTEINLVALTNLFELRFQEAIPSPFQPQFDRPQSESEPWSSADIGDAVLLEPRGQSQVRDATARLAIAGGALGGQSDSFHFVYVPLTGNGEIAARVSQWTPGGPQGQVGLTMREGNGAGAKQVTMGLTLQGPYLQWRAAGGFDADTRTSRARSRWIRLKREGDLFRGYISRNGIQWRLLDETRVAMQEELLVGFALAGGPTPTPGRTPSPVSQCLFEEIRLGTSIRYHSFTPRIVLKDGATLVGDIPTANAQVVAYAGPAGLETVAVRHIARLDFYWIQTDLARRIRRGPPGAWLASGEFIEGEFRGIREGRATISSILLGLRHYDIHNEILCVSIGELASPPPGPRPWFEVRTWAGSVWRGHVTELRPEGVVLDTPVVGRVEVAFHELQEMTRR